MDYSCMHYMVVLRSMDGAELSFDCPVGCMFLESLAEDGYDEFKRIVSEKRSEPIGSGRTSDACTGDIYIGDIDSYGMIHIHKYSADKFGVDIEIVPSIFSRSSKGMSIMKAVDIMGK